MAKIKKNLDPVYKAVALKMVEHSEDTDVVIYRLTKDCGTDIIYNRRNNRYIEMPSHSYAIIESNRGLILRVIENRHKRNRKGMPKMYKLRAYNLSKMRLDLRETLF